MARKLSKCVALAPLAVINDPTVDTAGDLRRGDVQSFYSFDASADGSRTSWVRVWADWFDIQGDGPDKLRLDLIDALAANVEAARAAGKRVILTSRSYPFWANNTAALPESAADPDFDPNTPGWAATLPDRQRDPTKNTKLRRFRYPGDALAGADSIDVGPGSPWYTWVKFLAVYFNPLRAGAEMLPEPYKSLLASLPVRDLAWVDHLEFVNEPNAAEMWPQRDAAGDIVSAEVVAQMFTSAAQIAGELGAAPGPVFVGPATADLLVTSDRLSTSVEEFTDALLTKLTARGFVPGTRVAWSTHNYTDVTRGCWTAPNADGTPKRTKAGKKDTTTNRAQLVRQQLLKHSWAGWPKGKPGDPRILLTEGGVQRAKLKPKRGQTLDALQAALLADAGKRLRDESGMGAGIDMFTHFLFYTTTDFDSGLVDAPASPGVPAPADVEKLKRAAYYAWRNLSETRT